MRQYPRHGAELLSKVAALQKVVPLVLHHQERWDGSGYPDGLEADDIPLGAQIVGICDVYHTLTSERSYRPALSEEAAQGAIQQASGRLWSPNLVEVLVDKVTATSG